MTSDSIPQQAGPGAGADELIECEECEGTGCDADLPTMTCPVCFGRGHLAAPLDVEDSRERCASSDAEWMTVPKSLITMLGEYLETTPCDCSHKRRYEQGGHLSHCHLFDLNLAWDEWQARAAMAAASSGKEKME